MRKQDISPNEDIFSMGEKSPYSARGNLRLGAFIFYLKTCLQLSIVS